MRREHYYYCFFFFVYLNALIAAPFTNNYYVFFCTIDYHFAFAVKLAANYRILRCKLKIACTHECDCVRLRMRFIITNLTWISVFFFFFVIVKLFSSFRRPHPYGWLSVNYVRDRLIADNMHRKKGFSIIIFECKMEQVYDGKGDEAKRLDSVVVVPRPHPIRATNDHDKCSVFFSFCIIFISCKVVHWMWMEINGLRNWPHTISKLWTRIKTHVGRARKRWIKDKKLDSHTHTHTKTSTELYVYVAHWKNSSVQRRID